MLIGLEERNPAKIPRVGAGGKHANIVFDKSWEESRSPMYRDNSPLKSPIVKLEIDNKGIHNFTIN